MGRNLTLPKTRTSTRPDIGNDHIRISFKRFQCLRSIAYAAQIHDQPRLNALLDELAAMESHEMAGLLNKEIINDGDGLETNTNVIARTALDNYTGVM